MPTTTNPIRFIVELLDFSGLPSAANAVCAELPQLMERLYAVVLGVVLCALSWWLYRRTNNRPNGKPPLSKPLFEYPVIEPCARELSQIKPIPYRPFKRGAYQ